MKILVYWVTYRNMVEELLTEAGTNQNQQDH